MKLARLHRLCLQGNPLERHAFVVLIALVTVAWNLTHLVRGAAQNIEGELQLWHPGAYRPWDLHAYERGRLRPQQQEQEQHVQGQVQVREMDEIRVLGELMVVRGSDRVEWIARVWPAALCIAEHSGVFAQPRSVLFSALPQPIAEEVYENFVPTHPRSYAATRWYPI